jgi:hypothetical protein
MSDSSGKNPVTNAFTSLWGYVILGFAILLALSAAYGLTTGLKPKKGNWGNALDVGSFLGALGNFTVRSGSDTFFPDASDSMNRIDGSASSPADRQVLTPDFVPTSDNAKSNVKPKTNKASTIKASTIAEQTDAIDVDLNGNAIIPLNSTEK